VLARSDPNLAGSMLASLFRKKLMQLREHRKIQWALMWVGTGRTLAKGDEGILRDVDIIEPQKLLLSNAMDGRIYCFNTTFASRLHEKIKPIVGRPIREVGELDF